MKQLEKLGSQGSRMLSEDQMKNVKGGEVSNGCVKGPWLCATDFCVVYDSSGKAHEGICTLNCLCMLEIGPTIP